MAPSNLHATMSCITRLPVLFAACAVTIFAASAAAQQPTILAPAAATADWKTLEATLPSLAATLRGPDAVKAARWVAAADLLHTFAAEHATVAEAGEARALEAQYLIRAAEAGDISHATRREQLVTATRADESVPVHSRFLVASLANRLRMEQTPKLDHAGRLSAYEQSAREMIAAFPAEPLPYWALTNLARDATDESAGAALAHDVATMAGVPPGVRVAAEAIIARHALIGKSPDLLYRTPEGKQHRLSEQRGSVVAIYTWSPSSKGSAKLAARLAGLASPQTIVIGVALERDQGAAEYFARQCQLPGLMIYDPEGPGGLLPQGLHATYPGEIFLFDRDGVVREVRAEIGLNAKLRSVEAIGGGKS